MKPSNKLMAIIAYVPVVGILYVVLFRRNDEFAMHHAKQCLLLTIGAVLTPVLWGIISWLLTLIPFVGPIIAAALFALVMLVYVFLLSAWVVGIIYTLQGQMDPLPIIGNWGQRFFSNE